MEHEAGSYPRHWEADVLLRDGSTMRIRPIRTSDAEALQAFHIAQSEESTYYRFFAPLRRLPDRDLTRLVTVDHSDRVALVMVSAGLIVAVGRYDRVGEEEAEVAFNVADAHQGRGLGSVLLEHLAAAARERGVSRFVADVLPGNARMIRVFTDAGYDVAQRYEDGVISLSFTIDPTQRSLDVVASREQRTDAASMRALLAPLGIVVVAEGQDASFAVRIAQNLPTSAGVTCVGAALRAVAEAAGHPWLPGLAELVPEGATLAFVADLPSRVLEQLPVLAEAGVRGVVVLGPDLDPAPDPAPDPARDPIADGSLLAAARRAGIRIVGPRSYGVVLRSGDDVVNGTLARQAPPVGDVALFSQSRAVSADLVALAARSGLGVATFVSAGERADVSGNDLLQYVSDLTGISAVGMYLESLGNPRKFARVVRRVSARLPVVAVVGAAQRPGHGLERAALEEAMQAAGVVVAPTMRGMVDAVGLLAHAPLPAGSRVAVIGSPSQVDLAAAQLGHLDADPLRVPAPWALGVAEVADLVADLSQQEWDVALIVHDDPLGDRDDVLATLLALADPARTVLAVAPGTDGPRPDVSTGSDWRSEVPLLASIEDAVAALTLADGYASWRRTEHGVLVDPDGVDLRRAREVVAAVLAEHPEGATLEPDQTRELLHAIGVTVLPSRVVRSTRQAVTAARELGWPVAVKSTVPALRHRADLGGVRLDIGGPLELVEAVRAVRARQGGRGGVELQTMAPLGVACLVRAFEDPVVGPVVSFGLAGDATDLLGDVTYALPPLRTGDVHRLVTAVRAAPRLSEPLTGSGGASPDLAALEDLVARISEAVDAIPQLRLLELRPALVSEESVVVLGARVVVAPEVRPDGARRALRA